MRWALVAAALTCAWMFSGGDATAQSLQCRQMNTAEERAACAERELDDLDDMVKYWREAARQRQDGYDYFARRRERCDYNAECLAREYQMEISELQMVLEPAARLRVTSAYVGPVGRQLFGPPNDLDVLMDRVITTDSRGWWINRYDRGSVRNTRVIATGPRSGIVVSDYTYNNGVAGWVRAHVVNGEFRCVEYHDFAGSCRPINANAYGGGVAGRFGNAAVERLASNR